MAFSSATASSELRALTQALLQQLRADHEAAAALGRLAGLRSCKELRETKKIGGRRRGLSADDLATRWARWARCCQRSRSEPSWVSSRSRRRQRLVEKLGAGALPGVKLLSIGMHVGDAGASAVAAALGRGALPRLKHLNLFNAAIGDAGLVALAPALRRRPALEILGLNGSPLGDEGLAALLAPPPPAGALRPPTGVLTKLKLLDLERTQITDAGCAALAAALDSGALPALVFLNVLGTRASAAAEAAVNEALERTASRAATPS